MVAHPDGDDDAGTRATTGAPPTPPTAVHPTAPDTADPHPCGWFQSSHELGSGLVVRELPTDAWLEAVFAIRAAPPTPASHGPGSPSRSVPVSVPVSVTMSVPLSLPAPSPPVARGDASSNAWRSRSHGARAPGHGCLEFTPSQPDTPDWSLS